MTVWPALGPGLDKPGRRLDKGRVATTPNPNPMLKAPN